MFGLNLPGTQTFYAPASLILQKYAFIVPLPATDHSPGSVWSPTSSLSFTVPFQKPCVAGPASLLHIHSPPINSTPCISHKCLPVELFPACNPYALLTASLSPSSIQKKTVPLVQRLTSPRNPSFMSICISVSILCKTASRLLILKLIHWE